MKPIGIIFAFIQICLGLFTPVGFFAIIMPWVLFFSLSEKNKKKIQTLLFYKRV